LPPGLSHAYTYNALNRLTLLGLTNGYGTQIHRYKYGLNLAGQRTNVVEMSGGVNVRQVAYDYDQSYTGASSPARVYRLTRERLYDGGGNSKGAVTNVYDPVGNRVGRSLAFTFAPVDTITNQSFVFDHRDLIDSDSVPNNANTNYDGNGNTLADQGALTGDLYDAENRLIQRGSGIQIAYDAEGNRVSKSVSGVTTYYLVDDQNPTGYAQVLAEYRSVSSGVAPNATYEYGTTLIAQSTPSTTRYYGYDGQGSVRLLTDATTSANVTDTYDYDACGMLLSGTGSTANNYRYTGQQWDPDLGMYYLRARYYKPNLGRFWTADSYEGRQEDPLSLHSYLYCQGNPVNMTDPSGCDGELAETLSVIFNGVSIFASRAATACEAYYAAERTVDAVELAATAAGGGSVSMVQVAALAVQFAPFGSLLGKVGEIGSIGGEAQALLKKVFSVSGSSKMVGEVGAVMACTANGFKSVGFKAASHGFDDVVEDAAGNLIIVEAKGGAGTLYKNQMSQQWILNNITKLKEAGQGGLADRLTSAMADGKLKGMVVSTTVKGADAFNPVAELKVWANIGAQKW